MASGKKTMAAIQQQMEWAAGKPRAGAAVVAIRGEPETKQSSRAGKEEATGPENHNQRIIPTMEDSMRQPLLILFGRHPGRGAAPVGARAAAKQRDVGDPLGQHRRAGAP
jgi:hypothetical protein